MRAFRWAELFSAHRIPFVERGANVKRGEINIRCPFCGSADPSYHMGINLETGWWSCWRNRSMHSGKSPLRLLMKLLDVPYWKAREIAGLSNEYVDPEGFDALAARLLRKQELPTARPEEVRRRKLRIPAEEFVEIRADRPRTRRFWDYLVTRGFAPQDVDDLCHEYGLLAGISGRWRDRVIVPYLLDGELVAWTGRAIGKAQIRYLDLDREGCLVPPKEMLLNGDCLQEGGKVLVLVEGPLDMLKLDFYGRDVGVRAVALSTNSITPEQVHQLHDAADRFKQVIVMLDTASVLGITDSMRLKGELYFLKDLRISHVPYRRKDAGELTPREAMRWTESVADEITQ